MIFCAFCRQTKIGRLLLCRIVTGGVEASWCRASSDDWPLHFRQRHSRVCDAQLNIELLVSHTVRRAAVRQRHLPVPDQQQGRPDQLLRRSSPRHQYVLNVF